MKNKWNGKIAQWWLAPLILFIFLIPQFTGNYIIYILNLIAIYSIVSIGLNLLTGFAGQISLGHAGFLAIGAYSSAIIVAKLHAPFLLAMLSAGVITAFIGLLVGLPAIRLRGFYLAIATLAFGYFVNEAIINFPSLTNGELGMVVPRASIGPIVFNSDKRFYYFIIVVMIVLVVLARNLLNTHIGRAFIALRDSEVAAETMGINLARYKTIAFIVSAFYTGIAGSLYAHLLTWIDPDSFDIFVSIFYITMIVVGGLASILGSILGAALLIVLSEALASTRELHSLVYGLAMMVFIMFLPYGLSGMVYKLKERWSNYLG